jgi:hypothetical protein
MRPSAAIHNVYKLKMQPELIQYLHVAAGFPMKPTWIKAVKNHQFSLPRTHCQSSSKTFPRKQRNGKRTQAKKQEWTTINKTDKCCTHHQNRA